LAGGAVFAGRSIARLRHERRLTYVHDPGEANLIFADQNIREKRFIEACFTPRFIASFYQTYTDTGQNFIQN